MMKKSACFLAALAIGINLPVYAESALIFTIEAPAIQESQVFDSFESDVQYQDFETVPNWNKVFRAAHSGNGSFEWEGVGVYEGTGGKVKKHNQYGGAEGKGKYLFIKNTAGLSVDDNPGVTLTFNTPVGYFGFWWSAGDYNNKLKITLTDGSEVNVLTGLVLTSEGFIDEKASEGGHMGNPTARHLDKNSREGYAYLNLFAKYEGKKIKKIRFHGKNFETDNHAIFPDITTPTGVPVPLPDADFGSEGRFNFQIVN